MENSYQVALESMEKAYKIYEEMQKELESFPESNFIKNEILRLNSKKNELLLQIVSIKAHICDKRSGD